MDEPVKPMFVLDNGMRVPVELRRDGVHPKTGKPVWRPIIEGDLAKLMPRIVGFDAEYWPTGKHSLKMPNVGATVEDQRAWAQRLIDNSPVFNRVAWRGGAIER